MPSPHKYRGQLCPFQNRRNSLQPEILAVIEIFGVLGKFQHSFRADAISNVVLRPAAVVFYEHRTAYRDQCSRAIHRFDAHGVECSGRFAGWTSRDSTEEGDVLRGVLRKSLCLEFLVGMGDGP